ncbi:fibronectin type III domain-containing protein [Bifidobacterium primatium]|uniref:fibronectin type III domain-containing protein n=1 Tax=Bifidobacterium primatium TaxID=2045438 RepID=UPI000C265277|nr:fibronectin type III domain-containing protein [Bifidobacterium primatium]
MFLNKKRSAALASAIAVATLGAGLVVPAASAADSTAKTTDDATLTWGLNKETNWRAYNPGTFNFLSAGVVDKTSADDLVEESEWKQSDGNVSIEKKQADGTYAAATWAGLKTTPDGKDLPAAYSATGEGSGNRVKLTKGTGTIDADKDNAEISWTGSFTVSYYSGQVQWYAKDLKLNVTGGKGTVTATLGGWATDMNDATVFSKIAEEKNVEIATLSNVDVKDDGTVVTPDFNENDVDGQGTKAKSWPKPFLDFVSKTGSGPYWYASGGAADQRKAPTEIAVSYTAKTAEDPTKVGNVGTLSADPTVINPTKDQQITVTGKGYTGSGAAFGTYVVIADKSVWQPGKVPTDQSAFTIQKWVRPANDPKDGYANLDKDGNWTQVLDIPANTLDASKQYVVGTFAAHMLSVTNRNLDHAVDLTLKTAEPETTAPAAPAKPTASVASATSVKVDWKAPSDGGSAITGYTVTLTPSKGDAVTKDVDANTTTATFGDLAAGVSYTATVTAKNAKGSSAASPASDAVTPNPDPASDLGIKVSPASNIDPSVKNTFTVKGTGFTGGAAANGTYLIVVDSSVWKPGQAFNMAYMGKLVGTAWIQPGQIKDGAFTGTVDVDANKLEYGKTYIVGTIAAHQLAITDRRLDTAQAITLKAQIPTAPSDVTLAKSGNADAKVSWKAPAAGSYDSKVAKYTVVVSDKDGKQVATKTVEAVDGQSEYTADFAGIAKPGTTLKATVVAIDAEGRQSAAVAAKDLEIAAVAPDAPQNVTVKQAGAHELLVSWSKPASDGGSAITGYTVTLTPSKGDAVTQDVDANTFQHVFTELDPNTEYTATVTAVNAAGSADASASEAAKPAAIEPKLAFADANKKAITSLTLNVNDEKTIYAFAQGENVGGEKVTWESSDKSVVGFPAESDDADTPATAAVGYDEQKVVAGKAGSATITITATIDGKKVTATLPVTVKDPTANNNGNQNNNGNNGSNNNGSNNNGSANGNASGSTTGTTSSNKTNAAAKANGTATKPNALSKTGSAIMGIVAAAVVLAAGAGVVLAARRRALR